jgi:hypothetical protein
MRGSLPTIHHLPAHALETRSGPPAITLLEEAVAVRYEGALSRRECAMYARGVYAGRSRWVANFDGVQFTLGRAWYTHLETDREEEYFARAAEADASMERFVPGLADRLLALMGRFVGAEMERREGWCGPGVHVFPADEFVSRHGGDVHFDLEGLTEEQVEAHAPALSAILMLQPAGQGGGLQVWDKRYEDDETEEAPGSATSAVVTYRTGDLVFIDSYRLHQICASSGPLDRMSVTAHAVRSGDRWEAWF